MCVRYVNVCCMWHCCRGNAFASNRKLLPLQQQQTTTKSNSAVQQLADSQLQQQQEQQQLKQQQRASECWRRRSSVRFCGSVALVFSPPLYAFFVYNSASVVLCKVEFAVSSRKRCSICGTERLGVGMFVCCCMLLAAHAVRWSCWCEIWCFAG